MIGLSRPTGSVRESLRACANNIKNEDLAKRLMAVESHLESAEKGYLSTAQALGLFSIEAATNVADMVTVEEMKSLYKDKFAKQGSPCRPLYNAIRAKAKICPFCNARDVRTLDHYLAQAFHPDFVLTPLNMVPSCDKCNKAKLAFNPATAQEQILHPYFEALPADPENPWLVAEVVEEAPLGVVFSARPPPHWDGDLAKRLVHQFTKLGLGDLYAAKASSEVAEIVFVLEGQHAAYGDEGVREHLLVQAKSRRAKAPHSWMAALYQGLADSSWFVQGGFRKVDK